MRVLWDEEIRRGLAGRHSIDAHELALCQEISRAFPALCDVFVPVVTPGYLERIGAPPRKDNSIPYGVVFEEWQGGGHNVQIDQAQLLPVVRLGETAALDAGLRHLAGFIRGPKLMLDFRDDGRYGENLRHLLDLVLDTERHNPLSPVDARLWCDLYVAWACTRFPERTEIPVDAWTFHTGAANEFLGAYDKFVHSLPDEATWGGLAGELRRWLDELRAKASHGGYRLKYQDVIETCGWTLAAVQDDFGWERLAAAAAFGAQSLKNGSLEGDALKHAQALNNVGVVWLNLAERDDNIATLEQAIALLREGFHAFAQLQGRNDVRVTFSLARALRLAGERLHQDESLRESLALF